MNDRMNKRHRQRIRDELNWWMNPNTRHSIK